MTSSRVYSVMVLEKDNFNLWLMSLKAAFQSKRLSNLLLEASKTEPTDSTKDAWLSSQGTGKSIIYKSLGKDDLNIISNCETVFEIVDKLRKRNNRLVNKNTINECLNSIEWRRNESADSFFSKLETIRSQMTSINMSKDDDRFIHIVLCQLPPFLNHLKKSYQLDLAKGTSISYDDLCETVTKVFDQTFDPHHNSFNKSTGAKALISLNNQPINQKSFCRYCKHKGHQIQQCPILKRKNEMKNNQQSTVQSTVHSSSNHHQLQSSSNINLPNFNQNQSANQNGTAAVAIPNSLPTVSSGDIDIPALFSLSNISTVVVHRPLYDKFIFDSGASNMMSPFKTDFINLKEVENGPSVCTANGPTKVEAIGDIRVTSFNSDKHLNMILRDVWYVPTLPARLFSEPVCRQAGLDTITSHRTGTVKVYNASNQIIFTGSCKPGVSEPFTMNLEVTKSQSENYSCIAIPETVMHFRMGHCPPFIIHKTIDNDLVSEVKVCKDSESCVCEFCIQSKMRKRSNKGSLIKTNIPGHTVHVDSYTPNLKSYKQLKTAFVFADEATGLINVQLTKGKEDYLKAFNQYLTFQRESLGTCPVKFHSDNGKELDNSKLKDLLNSRNIGHSFSTPYVKEENGLVESSIRHLVNTATSILLSSKLPKFLWNRLMVAAAQLINYRYRESLNSSPFVLFHGYSPSIKHLKIIGSPAYALIPKVNQKKFESKSNLMYVVECSLSDKIYYLYNPVNKEVEQHTNIVFLENKILHPDPQVNQNKTNKSTNRTKQTVNVDSNSLPNHVEIEIGHDESDREDENLQSENLQNQSDFFLPLSDNFSNFNYDYFDHDDLPPWFTGNESDSLSESSNSELNAPIKRKYNKKVYEKVHRNLRSNNSTDILHPSALICITDSTQNDSSCDEWQEAREEEILSHKVNNTWTLVERPENTNIVKCDFVYANKFDPISNEVKQKARLVAKGYSQAYGIDFFDTYAPTMSILSLKLMLSIVVQLGLMMHQFDVKTAFLNSNLKETIYMHQPPGFRDGTNRVCLLNKSIYGLKQAAKDWYMEFKGTLLKFGFQCLHSESCLFLYIRNGVFVIVGLYVDDGLIAANNQDIIMAFIAFLTARYVMKSSKVSKFIGLEIEQVSNGILIHQHQYIEKLLKHYDIKSNSRIYTTPLPKGFPINYNEDYDPEIHSTFRSVVCALLYLSRLSRPDISLHVGLLTTKLNNPSAHDMARAKRILLYLHQTKHYKMLFTKSNQLDFKCYTDANFAVERRGLSRSGIVIYVFGNPIGWSTKLQSVPAHSTTEAEWYALDYGLRECLWLKELLFDLTFKVNQMRMFCDNQSTISICTESRSVISCRTKHVERCYYYIKHFLESKLVKLEYVSTNDQIADLFTKSLPLDKHIKFTEMLRLN